MNSSTERSASEAPERLTWRETGSPSRSRRPSTSRAWATTQRSSSWIIPERSAASMKAEARQQLAVVAGHPQQQLVALDAARGEAADRLRSGG